MPELSFQQTTRLVESARGGDDAAAETLFERYLPRVRRMVALRLGKRLAELYEEEDLVQETLMVAFRDLKRFEHRSVGSFRNWLATLAVNRIRDCSRRDSAECRGGGRERPISAYESKILTESVFVGREPSPEELANEGELVERIEAALLTLSERDRHLFELRRIADCSFEEIAKEIGVESASSARSAVGRAIRRLSDELESEPPLEETPGEAVSRGGLRMDASIEELLDELIGRLDEDPGYDVESFLAEHPTEARELRAHLKRIRGQGLLPAVSGQVGALERIRRRFRLKARQPALREELSARYLNDDGLLPFRVLSSRYETLGEIDDTALNRLFCVRDRDLSRDVVMKLAKLPEELAGEEGGARGAEETLERFLTEAQVTGQLAHPGIVPVHDLGITADDRVYFTMKLVRGESLREIIDRLNAKEPKALRQFTLTRRLQIVQRVCEALAYAHSRGVVHRDLKPGNVMVGPFGEVQVMDWGLAKILGEEETASGGPQAVSEDWAATASGEVFGTPSYMAPEQARGEVEAIDARTDVFGVGALLYHFLGGRPPYWARSAEEVGERSRKEVLERAQKEVAERATKGELNDPGFERALHPVPRELAGVCLKALATKPEDRYASVTELARDLEAYQSDGRGAAWRDPLYLRTWKLCRRHPAGATAMAAALVVVVAAFLGWLSVQLAEQLTLRDQIAADQGMAARLDELMNEQADVAAKKKLDPFSKSRAYLTAFLEYELTIDGDEPIDQLAGRFAAIQARNSDLHENLLDGLYELSIHLELGSVDGASSVERQSIPEEIQRGGYRTRDEFLQWVHHRYPDLVAFWPRLASLLPAVDPEPWRLGVWTEWRRHREGEDRTEPLQQRLDDSDIAPLDGSQVRWLAHVVRHALDSRQELELLERSALERADQFPTRFRLGELAIAREDHQASIEHFGAAVAIRSDSSRARINLGISLTDAGRHEEAVEQLKKAIELDPESADPHSMVGRAYAAGDELATALEHHERAFELEPTDAIFLYNLAQTSREHARRLFESGQFLDGAKHSDRAIEVARLAVRAENAPYEAYELLPEALLDRDRLAEAIEALEELAPAVPELWEGLGASLLARYLLGAEGPYLDGALRAFDRSIELGLEAVGNLRGRGAALLLLEETEAAIESLQSAIGLDENDAQAHAWLALALRSYGHLAAAEPHRVKALSLPSDVLDELFEERMPSERLWLRQ